MDNRKRMICLMDKKNLDLFLADCMRAELGENKRVYMRAIRATLIALGYNEDYINGQFREYMENYYKDIESN